MHRFLPAKPCLKDIEKEARNLLHQMHRGDAVALARWHSLDPEAGAFQPRMVDVQYLVAREYGFRSWQKLKNHLSTPVQLACGLRFSLWRTSESNPEL
jgi:hypothetical protein